MSTPERITQAELARRLQVTRGAVTKAMKSGRIQAGPDGLLDPEEAERQWRANTRQNMKSASPAAKSKASGYAESRAKKERHAANILEMREAELTGRMMKTDLALDLMANMNFAWRGYLDHLPVHLAKAVYGKRELSEIETAIERELDSRLEHMEPLMRKVTYQGKALELPPSPLEREILERMWRDTKKRLNKIYAQAWSEIVEIVFKGTGIEPPKWKFLEDEAPGPIEPSRLV